MLRIRQDSRRRQESIADEQPMMPNRISGTETFEGEPFLRLPPKTISSLQRRGIAIGSPFNDYDEIPNEISVPIRQIRRLISEATTRTPSIHSSSCNEMNDDQHYNFTLSSDDYMDDQQLEAYLYQLAQEAEEIERKERESLMEITSMENHPPLRRIVSDTMETSSGDFIDTDDEDDEHFERLLESQIHAIMQQYNGGTHRILV